MASATIILESEKYKKYEVMFPNLEMILINGHFDLVCLAVDAFSYATTDDGPEDCFLRDTYSLVQNNIDKVDAPDEMKHVWQEMAMLSSFQLMLHTFFMEFYNTVSEIAGSSVFKLSRRRDNSYNFLVVNLVTPN